MIIYGWWFDSFSFVIVRKVRKELKGLVGSIKRENMFSQYLNIFYCVI